MCTCLYSQMPVTMMVRLLAGTNLRVLLATLCLASGSFILLTTWVRQVSQEYQQRSRYDHETLDDPDWSDTDIRYDIGSTKRGFLLDTPHCKIPDIDPFDPVILREIGRRGEIRCSRVQPSLVYSEGSYLRINWTKIKNDLNGDFKHCQYHGIRRGDKNSDFAFELGKLSEPFSHDILVPPQDEFMRVNCYSRGEGRISTNFHATVPLKPEVEERANQQFKQHKETHQPKETYNVHMIGIDSVSRLNFMRQMKQTQKFLDNELGGFEMSGYNKVADNTFVNIVPMLMGKFVRELGWNETMNNKPFDEYPFFWKEFSQAGYRTLYAEDAPYIAIFVYDKAGFHKPPGDYYNRPLSVALEKQRSIWNANGNCVGDRLETSVVLDYVTDFSRVFKDKPHFGFTFITRMTHDDMSMVSSADYAYVKFLRRFKEEGHLNNTVLIFFSDHGYRFGRMRNTYVGKVEERLPFFYLVFPPSFREKYPDIVKNLKINYKRLTTPFDVHETLKDLLYFDGVARKGSVQDRGISLLREIPIERTCEHAGIQPHWCLCLEPKKLKPTGLLARGIGDAVVAHINKELSGAFHLCAQLSLENISQVVKMASNDQILRFDNVFNDVINHTIVYGTKTEAPVIYQVTLSTIPGHALFEATISFDPSSGKFAMGGDISRINAYNDQSACIPNFKLKKMCFCL
ncbi:hypothetical protein EGW08_010032 [Elysia chlorotica]|uniref:DUF229 domain containing protein n=1 Tax=Elysia chlorotica TaxID=188477 RepID=A0A3S0ZT81_ELYCH|nr:hypothetical protein EGW08_010032 [Elysia chlorotica]